MDGITRLRKPHKLTSIFFILVLVVCGLAISAQPALAEVGYPDNLPPGQYSTVPYTIQTDKFTGVDSVGNPVCVSITNVVIDGSYAHHFNGPNNETAFYYIQKPSTNKKGYGNGNRSTTAELTSTVRSYQVPNNWLTNNTVSFPQGKYGFPISAYDAGDKSDPPNGSLCDPEDLIATRVLHEGYAENTRVWWAGVHTLPVADFDFEVTDPATREVTFTNKSTDGGSGNGGLSYQWSFGDDNFSNETNPVHAYSEPGPFVVKLTVSNGFGDNVSTSKTVLDELGLIVNSTSDLPAVDPEVGCDTGNLVDGKPECTLRAAIQASQAKDGGEITFDIAGGGVPSISVASGLPAITKNTSIDATTQSSGQVALVGPGTSGGVNGFNVTSGTVNIKGFVINNFATGILLADGIDHRITQNRIGVNANGTSTSQPPLVAIKVQKGSASIEQNQIVGSGGVYVELDSDGVHVSDNAVGVNDARTQSIGDVKSGVVVVGKNAVVENNVISATGVGVFVISTNARGSVVQDNKIGVSGTGELIEPGTYGVRVDGSPDVQVVDNAIVATIAGVGTAGSVQVEVDGDTNEVSPLHPNSPVDSEVKGGKTTISGNTIGSDDGEEYEYGIVSWAGSNENTIDGNTIIGEVNNAIEIDGGSNHKVTDNTIGVQNEDTKVETGILMVNTATSTVGGQGSAFNTIGASDNGIDIQGADSSVSVIRNVVSFAETGIDVDAQVQGNTTLVGNVVMNNEAGINISGDSVNVEQNIVSSNKIGIVTHGDDITIENNRIGLGVTGTTVLGNETIGNSIDGKVTVLKNIIAGHGLNAVRSTGDSVATLSANQIYDTGSAPISADAGPSAPEAVAAVRKTINSSTRTTLIFSDLPEAGGGKLEVFADDDCSADTGGEARYVLNLTRVTKPGETSRVVQILGNASRDSFTATYTDAQGHTSELSNCVEARSDYPDSDNDGSVDPIDQLLGMEDDPSAAWVVTDSEEFLLVKANSFNLGENGSVEFGPASLENVAIIDDPAPGAHPSGWQLPYGVLQFRVNVAEAGGRANVVLSNFLASSQMPEAQYFKYGPQTPGGPTGWYNFSYDEATMTGAKLITSNTVLGIRRSFSLYFQDGARGDSDGGANSTITDPGAMVLGSQVQQDTETQVLGTTVIAAPKVRNGSLPATGTSSSKAVILAMSLLLVGAGLIIATRRRIHLDIDHNQV